MQHYLSDSAAAAALAAEAVGSVSDVMRAEEKFATIFFTDIVGFKPLTERLPATELVAMLTDLAARDERVRGHTRLILLLWQSCSSDLAVHR